jgi:uncharacterized iron-regulated protein
MTCDYRRLILLLPAIAGIWLANACRDRDPTGQLKLYTLQTRQIVTGNQALDALKKVRLVVVGEHHTNPTHHRDELEVIRSLDDAGASLAIGLEMFRKNQQEGLDRWVAGKIDETDFEKIYRNNWNFPWSLYRGIFLYARKKQIPMVGLNVSEAVTRQVARQGFESLSPAQRGELQGITCNVTREYRDFIRSAFGAHGHGNMHFGHFCEAQLVWDTAMAINALDYLKEHPDRKMVLLTGSGHARKMGIPYRVKARSVIRVAVLLPRTPDIFEPDNLTPDDADFIIM